MRGESLPTKMDCEKFETAILDELYGELDELTAAAAKRHVAGCARCASRLGGLRATQRVATVPLMKPPHDLEERVLAAAERAQLVAPPRARVGEAISLAGSWAMRPQTAMAALFLVMIGTSVLLLRSKSARAPASAEVTVTEKGTPAPAPTVSAPTELARIKPFPASPPEPRPATSQAIASKDPPSPAATVPPAPARAAVEPAFPTPSETQQPDDLFDAAVRSYRAGHYKEAMRAFDALSPSDPNAPELWAARSIREGTGCRAAVGRFDKTAQRYKQSPPGWDALLEGALCYRSLGEFGTARARLSALLGVDSHKDRARAELDRINDLPQVQGSGSDPPAKAASARPRSVAAVATQGQSVTSAAKPAAAVDSNR